MKKVLLLMFCLNMQLIFSQPNDRIKSIKCLDNIPTEFEEIQKYDTIYILYRKCKDNGKEQVKQDIVGADNNNGYYFLKNIFFSFNLDYNSSEKKNIKKPVMLYKSKSFICKNLKRTIDINFIKKYFQNEFLNKIYKQSRVIFIIDLDDKINNKYKVIQVNNNPLSIIE